MSHFLWNFLFFWVDDFETFFSISLILVIFDFKKKMLTGLEPLELCVYNLKIKKIWFISISLLWLDSKNSKIAVCGVKFGIINLCLQSEQSCFQRF